MEGLFPADRVVAIAHRGGAALRPENTMAAFDHACALGVYGIECDVHLSRDGVPMVFHDSTLERTTNASGPIAARDSAELEQLDAGFHFQNGGGFPYRDRGLGIPRLADVLDRHPDLAMVVEVKGDRAEVVEPIVRVILAARRPSRVFIGGFSHTVLQAFRMLAPGIPTGASREEVEAAGRRVGEGLTPERSGYALFQIPYFFRGQQILTAPFVQAATRAGIAVHSWVIDEIADIRTVVQWGVRGVISDRPDVAIRAVGEFTN